MCCMLSCFSRVRLFVTPWTVALRLLCPWDSPGKNTGGGCHALLHNIHIRVHIYECIHSLRCPLLVMYTLPIKKWSNDLLDIKTKDSWRTRILQMGWGGDCTRSRGQGGKMFMPCRILFLRSRIQPRPLVLGSWSLNHWTTRQVPYHDFLYRCLSAASVC